MFLKIILALVAVVVLILIVASFKNPLFKIERSTTINAPASTVFAQVNDFHKWEAWSPWEKLDPEMKKTYDGAQEGKGAGTAWVGKKSGEGRMTITESKPHSEIQIRLEFIKPMKAVNDTLFTFKPEGNGTVVTWIMTGHLNLMSKVFHTFVNMDKLVGNDFEKGLAEMKAISEKK